MRAFVLRVRFTTVPALMMRSNSKQPFWLTGDMMSTLAFAILRFCIWGGSSFMPAERMATGLAGVCWPSSVAAMSAVGVTFTDRQAGSIVVWVKAGRREAIGALRCSSAVVISKLLFKIGKGDRGDAWAWGRHEPHQQRQAHRL